MNLTKPPYPDALHSALHFLIQVGHRKTAIDTAIDVLHDQAQVEAAQNGSVLWTEAPTVATSWVVESLTFLDGVADPVCRMSAFDLGDLG